jgi:hypothetical protein
LRDSPEILETVNAGAMTVPPGRLQRITADNLKTGKLKAVVGIANFRPENVSEDIRLASARRARARAAQELQIEIRFASVIPTDRQFVADLLNVRRFQTHRDFNITTRPILRAITGLGSSVVAGVSPAADDGCRHN